jgi:hypothetical protein
MLMVRLLDNLEVFCWNILVIKPLLFPICNTFNGRLNSESLELIEVHIQECSHYHLRNSDLIASYEIGYCFPLFKVDEHVIGTD